MTSVALIKKNFGYRSGHIRTCKENLFSVKPIGSSREGKPRTEKRKRRNKRSIYRGKVRECRYEGKNYRIGSPVEQQQQE